MRVLSYYTYQRVLGTGLLDAEGAEITRPGSGAHPTLTELCSSCISVAREEVGQQTRTSLAMGLSHVADAWTSSSLYLTVFLKGLQE